MQRHTVVLLLVAIVAVIAGILIAPGLLSEPTAPVMRWSAEDEVDGSDPAAAESVDDPENVEFERSSADAVAAPAVDDNEPRVDAVLRGRIVSKFGQPVAQARVWLEFAQSQQRGRRGNRPRRIPEPVQTDSEGRFAFQGQTFRTLRVTLQVDHARHAPGVFDKDLGTIGAEVDLGDFVLMSGGQVRGRVTDLDGNGVPAAELTLQPENQNRMRWMTGREDVLPKITADASGFYSYANVPAGDFSITALAKHHTEGRSNTFAVEEDQVVDVPDIELGPGYELTGHVRTARGEPIANADVSVRATPGDGGDRNGGDNGGARPGAGRQPGGGRQGGRGAFLGRGREHRTKTDERGQFFLEHLPGSLLELNVTAEAYLDFREPGIDAKLGHAVNVAMQDGLRITGVVQHPTGDPVTSYAVQAVRVRGLVDPSLANVDLNALMNQMRNQELDETTRQQLRQQMEQMRRQFADRGNQRGGRGGRGDSQGGPNRRAEAGKAETHPDGKFLVGGLQEGVYEVHVDAPDHAHYQSTEIELRMGMAAPELKIALDPGVYVAGAVLDERGEPISGARVELRSETAGGGRGGPGGGNRRGGNRGTDPAQPTMPDFGRMATEWARNAAGANVQLEARTDDEGVFVIKHVPRGRFRLSASANGFADARVDAFDLQSDRSDFEMRLTLLGSIQGTVSGYLPQEREQVQVGAMLLPEGGDFGGMFGRGGGRGMRMVNPEADGSYRIDGLTPGNYVVRSWIGSPQDLMRELAPKFLDGSLQADVAVRGGDPTRFDLALTRPQVGAVAGNVLHNGVGASGFRVELQRQDDGTTRAAEGQGPGGRGGPGGFGFMMNFGRSHQATVAASGNYRIENVPAGVYRLRITPARRGGALVEEQVQVFADATTERSYTLQTSKLSGTITRDDGGDVKDVAGRVSLLPNLTEVPADLNVWLRQNQSFDGRLSNGAFEIDSIPSGSYLLVLQTRSNERTTMQVVVQGDSTVRVPLGKPTGSGAGSDAPR